MRISETISDILESVIECDNFTDILCDSTEDMLFRIEQANQSLHLESMNPVDGGLDSELDSSGSTDWFTKNLVVMSEDVVALYPSLHIEDTMCAIDEIMKRTDMSPDVEWKEIAKFLAVNRDNNGDSEYSDCLRMFVPEASADGSQSQSQRHRGRRRTTAFLTTPNDNKWTWRNTREPSEQEVKILFTEMIKIIVAFIMKNHIYSFDGKHYRQTKGGPIGLRLTGVIAKLVMIEFGKRWRQVASSCGISAIVDGVYVDDHNIATWEVKPGIRYDVENKCVVLKPDEISGDLELSGSRRTANFITSITNTIMPRSIVMTYDIPDNHKEGWLPVLDLQVQVCNDRIVTKFYKKPMATDKVIHRRSAISDRAKRSILVQEGVRRLYNCSPNLPWSVKSEIMQDFAVSMMKSGHSESFRSYVIEAVVSKYDRDLRAYCEGIKPLYRAKGERPPNKPNARSKTAWLENVGCNNMLVIPSTPGSKLLKLLQHSLRNMEEPEGVKTLIREDYGVSGKLLLCKSDPFPQRSCGGAYCMVCTSSGNNSGGATCRLSNVGYDIKCKHCDGVYIGMTSRNCRTRSREHLRNSNSTICKHAGRCHPRESQDRSDVASGYEMKVVRRFKDPMTRQVNEAVRICRAVKMKKRLLNEKKEFNVLHLIKVSAGYDE